MWDSRNNNHFKKAMRKSILLSLTLLFTMPSSVLLAKQKEDKKAKKARRRAIKAWKKRKRAMKPLQFRELIEEAHESKMRNQQLAAQIVALEKALEEAEKSETYLSHSKSSSHADSTAVEDNGSTQAEAQGEKATDQGLIFKVQVGAFSGEQGYWRANKLKEELRAQGKETWIVVIKNGKRVPLSVVLKSILNKKSIEKQ